jgi:methionyl-tRNA formyltransferase
MDTCTGKQTLRHDLEIDTGDAWNQQCMDMKKGDIAGSMAKVVP